MIPANRLLQLKKLFAEDGVELTDAQALEIGLWLTARVRPLIRPMPLDKMKSFGTMKVKSRKAAKNFVNLYEWRKNLKHK